jgi:hypothetical protein
LRNQDEIGGTDAYGHHARVETNVNVSIDQQGKFPTSQDDTDKQQQDEKSEKQRKFELSPSQVVGGALAAMTAAALGSRLGAAGTIIGAAAASVIAAVSGALYTASLRHTHEKVRTVWPTRWKTNTPATVQLVSDPAQPNAAAAPAQQLTRRKRPESRQRPRLPWKNVMVGALLAFGIAAVAITGLELVSGQALSGDDGTTISQVSRPDRAEAPTSDEDEQQPKENAPTARSEPRDSGLRTGSSTPTSEESSTQQDEPSTAPPSAPSTSRSETPAATPSSQPTGER